MADFAREARRGVSKVQIQSAPPARQVFAPLGGLPMPREPRRIVTGHDGERKSVIVIDGPPTPFGAYWLTDATPVDNASSGDAGLQVRKLEPPPGGSVFRFATIPPEDPKVSREERERQTAKM